MRSASRTTRVRGAFAVLAVTLSAVTGCSLLTSTGPKTPVGGLWIANYGSVESVVQYTTSQLAASTSAAPTVAIGLGQADNVGVAFDSKGNLWMTTFSNNTIVEYSASEIKATGDPSPVVTITATGTQPAGLAFDSHGNLWVAGYATNAVVEYSAGQLGSTGSPDPAITISAAGGSLQEPVGLAFDASGNLWVSNTSLAANTVVEFAAGQLSKSGSPTPAVTLSANANSISGPLMIAFDASGNLWLANGDVGQSTVVEFSASQLTASGSPVPAVTLSSSSSSLDSPGGLAFDGSGNLWVSNFGVSNLGSSTVVEFTAGQIATSGSPTPSVTLGGAALQQGFGLAFYPHASGLPIKE